MKMNIFRGKRLYLCRILFILMVLVMSASCGVGEDDTNGNPSGKTEYRVPDHLRGKWFRLDTTADIYLKGTTESVIEEIGENMIKITDERGTTYFVSRFGTHQASLSMVVSSETSSTTKGISGIGGLSVILQDLNDDQNRHEVHTEHDGSVNNSEMISSDYEVIIPESDTRLETSLDYEVTGVRDVAVITPAKKGSYSFKTNLDSDQEFVYGDYATYTGRIKITNIGEADAQTIQYKLSVDDTSHIIFGDIDGVDDFKILETLEPGKSASVSINYKTRYLSDMDTEGDSYDDKINIAITDYHGTEWYDYVPIRIYRRAVVLNVDSNKSSQYSNRLTGLIVFPDRSLKRFSNPKSYRFPFNSEKPYQLILSNLQSGTESIYSIGFESQTYNEDIIDAFNQPQLDEGSGGNDTEKTAVSVTAGTQSIGYLTKEDIDYYLLDMSDAPVREPVKLTCDESRQVYAIYDTTHTGLGTRGNGDGRINPGESVNMNVAITNISTSTAYEVTACLSLATNDDYITIPETHNCSDDNRDTINDIAGGATVDCDGEPSERSSYFLNSGDFLLQVSEATPVGHEIDLILTMTDMYNHQWTHQFSIPVEENGAELSYYPPPASVQPIYDQYSSSFCPDCNEDGTINPGENIRLNIAIRNTGISQANNVTAEIALKNSEQAGVEIIKGASDPNAYRSTIEPGQVVACGGLLENHSNFLTGSYGDYQIGFAPDISSGIVDFVLTIKDEFNNSWQDEFQLPVEPATGEKK